MNKKLDNEIISITNRSMSFSYKFWVWVILGLHVTSPFKSGLCITIICLVYLSVLLSTSFIRAGSNQQAYHFAVLYYEKQCAMILKIILICFFCLVPLSRFSESGQRKSLLFFFFFNTVLNAIEKSTEHHVWVRVLTVILFWENTFQTSSVICVQYCVLWSYAIINIHRPHNHSDLHSVPFTSNMFTIWPIHLHITFAVFVEW